MSFFMINDHSKEVLQALEQAKETALEAAGLQCEGYAIIELERNPRRVDTGLLRNSITHALSGETAKKPTYFASIPKKGRPASGSYSGTAPNDPDTKKAVYIGTNVEYALYVHDGTSRMLPNRFMKNALYSHASEYIKIIEEYLKK